MIGADTMVVDRSTNMIAKPIPWRVYEATMLHKSSLESREWPKFCLEVMVSLMLEDITIIPIQHRGSGVYLGNV